MKNIVSNLLSIAALFLLTTPALAQDYSTQYLFATEGKIITEEVKIQDSGDWPDFVFDKAYLLMDLTELESFIQTNGHLPNIPSAQEVAENNGFEVGNLNKKLLQKIEELTLYLIQERKERQKLEAQLSAFLDNQPPKN